MLDFWLHKNPGYFSMIPAYENIKLFNHYTFLLVSISLNQRKCGKWYFFHLLLIRSEIQNILIFPIHTKQCRKNILISFPKLDLHRNYLRTYVEGIIKINNFFLFTRKYLKNYICNNFVCTRYWSFIHKYLHKSICRNFFLCL